MPINITMTMTGEEAQYILDAINTHVKTHGLKVATMGVMLLAQFQTAAGNPMADKVVPTGPGEA